MSRRFRVVSLRPASFEGSGDSRRAASIISALRDAGALVDAQSILAQGEGIRSAVCHPRPVLSLFIAVLRYGRRLPLQWLVAQSLTTVSKGMANERTIYVTSRVAPASIPPSSVIDFVDSLADNALSRAGQSRVLRRFWLREARLLSKWECQLAAHVELATAVSSEEAALIGPEVVAVANERTIRDLESVPVSPAGKEQRTIIFAGSLYYYPNHEAAVWMIKHLIPELMGRGWMPHQFVIAGRRPSKKLLSTASKAGVTVLADVSDISALLRSANVSVVPMRLGSGVQGKVADSLVVGTPAVITPKANRGLGLKDSCLVRIVTRSPVCFADAIEAMTTSTEPLIMPPDVAALIEASTPGVVQERWRELLLASDCGC